MYCIGKKTPGEPGHTGAHGHTEHTDKPHNHPNPTSRVSYPDRREFVGSLTRETLTVTAHTTQTIGRRDTVDGNSAVLDL